MLDESCTQDLVADRQLAQRIAGGDDAAFELFVKRYFARVARIVGRFFRRSQVIEDVIQEVFVKALLKVKGYRGDVPLEHWIARVAVNACYDELRRDSRRPEFAVSQMVDEPGEFLASLTTPESSTFWAREEARLYAEQLLARLPPAERMVLTLLELEGLSVAEVAEITGWSKTNVKVRAFRARGRIRKSLGRL